MRLRILAERNTGGLPLALALPLVVALSISRAMDVQADPVLTLEQALSIVERNSSVLINAQANVQALEAQLNEANAFLWHNPELSGGAGPRSFADDERTVEWEVGVAQTLELAGQPKHRREAAQQELSAAREAFTEVYLQLRTDVTQRFTRAAALQERVAVEEDLLKLVDGLSEIVRKRLKAGEDTRLDANLAAVEADRTRNQLGQLREELIEARRELASVLQLPANQLPLTEGGIPSSVQTYSLNQLLARVGERPLVRSLRHREAAARSRLSLERAAAYPDVTLRLGTGMEGPSGERERFLGLTAAVPLPLFKRNQAAIGRAAADLTSAQVERESTERDARTAVVALWERLQSLRERVGFLRETTLPRLEENQRLARRSFEVGQIGTAEVLLATRQLNELRRDAIQAQAELALTVVQLEQTAGWIAVAPPR